METTTLPAEKSRLEKNHEEVNRHMQGLELALIALAQAECYVESINVLVGFSSYTKIRINPGDFRRFFHGHQVRVRRSDAATHYYADLDGVEITAIELHEQPSEGMEVM